MSRTFPIIPEKVSDLIQDLIQEHCPISQAEIVEATTLLEEQVTCSDDEDSKPTIYKYVGFISQDDLQTYIPSKGYKLHDYMKNIVSLYESEKDNTVIFWCDNVLVVMISTDEDQHDGVMNLYGDIGLLLKYVGNSHIIGQLVNMYKR